MSLDFFKKIEDSLKCNFKFTNMILNSTEKTNEEELEQEQRRVKKIEKQLVYFADKEPAQLNSRVGEEKVHDMMDWFINLEAPMQRNFIENLLREKMRAG